MCGILWRHILLIDWLARLPFTDVHRLGRTARAGTEGSGLLILAPWEQRFLANKHMVNIPIKEREIKEDEVKLSLASLKEAVDATMMTLEDKLRCSAYQVCLLETSMRLSRPLM